MRDTPFVMVYPRGQLTADDKAALRDAGVIAIEADDPEKVQQLHICAPLFSSQISGDAIVQAALYAITHGAGTDQSEMNRAAFRFVKHIADAISAHQVDGDPK